FDLAAGHRTLAEAFAQVTSRFLVLSFSSDWLFPTYQARELVDALKAADAEVSFAEIESPYGHDAFLLEPEQQRRYLEPFLARVTRDERERDRPVSARRTSAGEGDGR
ncbi:MAG TPA: hypothetical protein VFH17_07625, partial [Coriobacteriia bacterium]|nr:hypothetical protein [Coriobacteriia bacterium]